MGLVELGKAAAPTVLPPLVLERTDCARGRAVSKDVRSPVTISHFPRVTFLFLFKKLPLRLCWGEARVPFLLDTVLYGPENDLRQ